MVGAVSSGDDAAPTFTLGLLASGPGIPWVVQPASGRADGRRAAAGCTMDLVGLLSGYYEAGSFGLRSVQPRSVRTRPDAILAAGSRLASIPPAMRTDPAGLHLADNSLMTIWSLCRHRGVAVAGFGMVRCAVLGSGPISLYARSFDVATVSWG
jgi:hypothetical protein